MATVGQGGNLDCFCVERKLQQKQFMELQILKTNAKAFKNS